MVPVGATRIDDRNTEEASSSACEGVAARGAVRVAVSGEHLLGCYYEA